MFEASQSFNVSIREPSRQRQHSLTLSQYSSSQSLIGCKLKSYQTPINKSSSNLSKVKSKSVARSCSHSRCSSQHETTNNFKPIKTSQKYMKELLEKAFNKSLALMNAGEILTQHNMVDAMTYLGLFRDPPTVKDMAAAKNIIKVLDRQSKGIRRQNLLKLIFLISKIPLDTEKTEATDNPSSGLRRDTQEQLNSESDMEIGWINRSGAWVTTTRDERIIRDVFGHLNYNKISNENVKYIKNPDVEKHPFKPKILSVSSNLCQKYRRRLISNADQKTTEDLLMIHGQLTRSKAEHTKKIIERKQVQKCTFKPKINKSSSNSKQVFLLGRGSADQKPKQMTSSQIRQQKQFKQCSFKPKILLAHKQNHEAPTVKNETKIVNRMKDAYNKRIISNVIKQRGYPKQVNWIQYLQNSKNIKKEKKPILSIDIKISNEVELLHIYHGESLESLTCKILVKNKLPYQYQQNVESLLRQVLEESMSVQIKDGFIYSK